MARCLGMTLAIFLLIWATGMLAMSYLSRSLDDSMLYAAGGLMIAMTGAGIAFKWEVKE